MENPEIMSVPRLAKHFGVGRTTVFSAIKRRELPAFQIGRDYRVKVAEVPHNLVERWGREREKPIIPNESHVYFIAAANGPIKIGLSKDPLTRLARLNTSSPVHLSLVAYVCGGADLERSYHARFAQFRMNGEWFSPHPDILAEIDRLTRTGRFPGMKES